MALVVDRRSSLAVPFIASFAAALLACGAESPGPDLTAEVAQRADQGSRPRRNPRITVRSLGPGMALGVNDRGQIAGSRYATPANDGLATLWEADGSVSTLFPPTLGGSSHAFDVSDAGAVVGVGSSSSNVYPFSAFVWTSSAGLAGLATPDGSFSRARSVNASGQIAGDVEGGPAAATLWDADGKATSLGTLGGPESGADDINDAGQVVGWSHTPDYAGHAFLWTPGAGMRDLGTLGGSWSEATGINALGHVTGWSMTAEGRAHAFLWKPETGMVDLDPKGGESFAEAVNDRDEVVGYHYPEGGALAFFWAADTGLVELGTLGGEFSRAWDLNDQGVIVGDSTDGITPELATVWTIRFNRGNGP